MDLINNLRAMWTSPFKAYYLKTRLPGHDAAITRLSVSKDGLHLASGGKDEVVKIWNLKDFTLARILRDKHQRWGQITSLRWAQEEAGGTSFLLIGTARGRLAIYSWTSRENTFHQILNEAIYPENTPIEDLDVNLSTRSLVVGSQLGELRHYKFNKKALSKPSWCFRIRDEKGLSATPRSIYLRDPDEALIFLLDCGRLLCIDVPQGRWKSDRSLDAPVGHASLSVDGRHALVDNMCGGFDVYDTATFTSRRAFEVPGKHNHVKDASFVEGGEVIACPSENGLVYLFNVNRSDPVQVLYHNRGGVRRVTGHDDQERHLIVSASNSERFDICIWEKLIRRYSSADEVKRSNEAPGLWALQCLTIALIALVVYDKWAPFAMKVLADASLSHVNPPDSTTGLEGTARPVDALSANRGRLATHPSDSVLPVSRDISSLPSGYYDQVKTDEDEFSQPQIPLTSRSELASLAVATIDSLD